MIQFLSYLAYFVAGSMPPLQRRWLAKKKDPGIKEQIDLSFKVMFIVALLSLALPLFSPFQISGDRYHLLFLALISGVFGAGALVSFYIAQKRVEAGVFNLVGKIHVPVTIVLASILLSEGLTFQQVIGTLLLLVAMVIVSKNHRIGTLRFDKYFLLVVAGGVILSFALAAERALQKTTGFAAGTMISWWSQCLCLGLAALIAKSKPFYSRSEIAVTGVLQFVEALAWVILVFSIGNLSIASGVATFKVVVIFIGAAIFLGEREDLPRKFFGSLIAVAGLLLMLV